MDDPALYGHGIKKTACRMTGGFGLGSEHILATLRALAVSAKALILLGTVGA
jgi:hypothetical protein